MLKHHVPKSSELFRISSKGYYYKISLLVSLVTIFIITDILLSNISPASIPLTILYTLMQESYYSYFFPCIRCSTNCSLNYIKKNGERLWLSKLHLIHTAVMIGEFVLISLIFTIIVQIVFEGHYNVILLAFVNSISYAYEFYSNDYFGHQIVHVVFTQARSGNTHIFYWIVLQRAFCYSNYWFFGIHIWNKSISGLNRYQNSIPSSNSGLYRMLLYYFNSLFSIVSFIATWLGAALLLRHYSKKFAHNTYWIIVCAPLVYFLSQFTNILHFYNPFIKSDLNATFIAYQLVFSLNSTIGGVLFAVVFWTASKKLEHIATLKNYLTIAGFGFFLFFLHLVRLPSFKFPILHMG